MARKKGTAKFASPAVDKTAEKKPVNEKPKTEEIGLKKKNTKPIESQGPEMVGEEISSQLSDIYKTTGQDFNPDKLVQKKGLKIYKTMLADDQVKACLSIKKLARLSTKWKVDPGQEDNELSQEIAKFCTYVLQNISTSMGPDIKKSLTTIGMDTVSFKAGTFENVLYGILSALDFGFSITEKIWRYYDSGPYAGKLGIVGLKTRDPEYYDFSKDRHGNLIGILPPNRGMQVVNGKANVLPVSKFVIYSYRMQFSNWYGESDLFSAYRSWWSKDMTIKWWNIFSERFGSPAVMATYPSKGAINPNVLRDIDDILDNLQAKSGFRVPDNVKISFLEATRRGEDTFKLAVDYHDNCIARSILCPSKLGISDQAGGGGGSYALSQTHFDVFMMVLEHMGTDISEMIVNEQLLKPLVQYNYGEIPDELMPKFGFESLIGDNVSGRATVVGMLASHGLIDKREEWVRKYLNVPKRDTELYPHNTELGQPNMPVFDPNKIDPATGKPYDSENPFKKPGEDPKGKKPTDDTEEEDRDDKNKPKRKFKAIKFVKRKPNQFEKKVNFQKIKDGIEVLDESLVADLQEVIKGVKNNFVKQCLKVFEEKDTGQVKNLILRGMNEFGSVLRNNLVKVHLDTKLGQFEELVTSGAVEGTVQRKFSAMFAAQDMPFEPWEPVDPVEAMDYFNRKVLARVVTKDGEKKLIPLGKSKETKFYNDRAFYITGVEEKYILDQSKNILLTGISKGWSNADMQGSLNDLFDKYLATGQLMDGELMMPSRIETIVRTNVTEAYNRGRLAMMNDPEISDAVPYIQWSSIIDERTSDYCSNMDEKVFRKGEIEPPPAHFNCRSLLVPITSYEVDRNPSAINLTTQAAQEAMVPRVVGFRACDNKCSHNE